MQLLKLHLTRQVVFILYWLALLFAALGTFGHKYGVPYLFLDPEYLGQVGYVSFAIVGISFGIFWVSWNVSSYLLNAERFPFLASLKWPFATYMLNNSIVPIFFVTCYLGSIFHFQSTSGLHTMEQVVYDLLGFVVGIAIVLFIAIFYFHSAYNITAPRFQTKKPQKSVMGKDRIWKEISKSQAYYNVDSYLSSKLRFRKTRSVEHYSEQLRRLVFQHHHINALIAQILIIVGLYLLGILGDQPYFQFPAASGIFLVFAILIAMSGIFRFWTGPYSVVAFVVVLALLQLSSSLKSEDIRSQVSGIRYDVPPSAYQLERIQNIPNKYLQQDLASMQAVIDQRLQACAEEKPKLVIVAASGGGLSASMFSAAAMHQLDSISDGQLYPHIALMTGSSGGAIGTAFYRSMRHMLGVPVGRAHGAKIGNDLLNPIWMTIASNDIFYPWRSKPVGDHQYRWDRGMALEFELNKNTRGLLNKPLKYYKYQENKGLIPIFIGSATITNDYRRLLFSAQRTRHLTRPPLNEGQVNLSEVDGVEWQHVLQQPAADSARLISLLRASATYPYILPVVTLPTRPTLQVMDAGLRDNYALEVPFNLIHQMRDYIETQTSGVVIVQIRQSVKSEAIDPPSAQGALNKIVEPIGSIAGHLATNQDYHHDYILRLLDDIVAQPIDLVRIEYDGGDNENRAALSFHLTNMEKRSIERAARNTKNRAAYQEIIELTLGGAEN